MFDIEQLVQTVTNYNTNNRTNYRTEIKTFNSQAELQHLLTNSINKAVVIGYSYNLLLGGIGVTPENLGAHWSVVVPNNMAGAIPANLILANPHGTYDQCTLEQLYDANVALNNGTFDTTAFFVDEVCDPYNKDPDSPFQRADATYGRTRPIGSLTLPIGGHNIITRMNMAGHLLLIDW